MSNTTQESIAKNWFRQPMAGRYDTWAINVPGSPGYIGWRNRFFGIDPWALYRFKNSGSDLQNGTRGTQCRGRLLPARSRSSGARSRSWQAPGYGSCGTVPLNSAKKALPFFWHAWQRILESRCLNDQAPQHKWPHRVETDDRISRMSMKSAKPVKKCRLFKIISSVSISFQVKTLGISIFFSIE